MTYREPWSKRHKQVSRGARFNLSNSFAQPLDMKQLIELTQARGDHGLVEMFHEHSLEYTAIPARISAPLSALSTTKIWEIPTSGLAIHSAVVG